MMFGRVNGTEGRQTFPVERLSAVGSRRVGLRDENVAMEDRRTGKDQLLNEGGPIDVSENIFADLGLPDAEEYNAKAQLALSIRRVIRSRGMTQKAAALQTGVHPPDMSNVVTGRLEGIGLERLASILNRLDQDVEIRVRPTRTGHARTYVSSGETESVAPMAAAGKSH